MPNAIAYFSQATQCFGETELQQLADRAAQHNAKSGISGYFFFEDDIFFQYLEGNEDALEVLMAKIGGDERHRLKRQIKLGHIPDQLFSNWRMRYIRPSAMIGAGVEEIFHTMLLKLSENQQSDMLLEGQIMTLVRELAAYQSCIHEP